MVYTIRLEARKTGLLASKGVTLTFAMVFAHFEQEVAPPPTAAAAVAAAAGEEEPDTEAQANSNFSAFAL